MRTTGLRLHNLICRLSRPMANDAEMSRMRDMHDRLDAWIIECFGQFESIRAATEALALAGLRNPEGNAYSKQQVGNWAMGKFRPSYVTMAFLSEASGIPIPDLLDVPEPPRSDPLTMLHDWMVQGGVIEEVLAQSLRQRQEQQATSPASGSPEDG